MLVGKHLNRRLEGAAYFKYVYVGLIAVGALLVAFTLAGVATG